MNNKNNRTCNHKMKIPAVKISNHYLLFNGDFHWMWLEIRTVHLTFLLWMNSGFCTWLQQEGTTLVECRCFSLSLYLCDLRLSGKPRSSGPRQKAGHDNEAGALQEPLPLLARHRGNPKTLQDNLTPSCVVQLHRPKHYRSGLILRQRKKDRKVRR